MIRPLPCSAAHAKADDIVFVVDDDASVCEALSSLVRSAGLRVQTFGSAQAFLGRRRWGVPACLVLDVGLPDLSGFELQSELARLGEQIPIVFITGHGDVPMSVKAIKAGAVEFLLKPFRDEDLLDAIDQALERARATAQHAADHTALRNRYCALSVREREVMAHIVRGLLNKQTAAELGIAEITVKVHRRHIMQKMGVRCLADLVRISEKLA
jgi:FixJ family two-component response regulator